MKAIFLDIDGVLNSYSTNSVYRSKSRCGSITGIDKDKVRRLATIVEKTSAKLILISSWKTGWVPNKHYNIHEEDILFPHAKYLDNHLKKKGGLRIYDKTKEKDPMMRGSGIRDYLQAYPEITEYVVLDDEIFPDYKECGIFPHLVLIDGCFGLQDSDISHIINILNGELNEDEPPSHYSESVNSSDYLDVILS